MLSRIDMYKQLNEFKQRAGAGTNCEFHFNLVGDIGGLVITPDTTHALIDSSLSIFKGNATVIRTAADFSSPIDDGITAYTQSTVLTWRYDSGAGGSDSNPLAHHVAVSLYNTTTLVRELLDFIDLDPTYSMDADGKLIELRYKRYALQCDE